MDMEVSKMGFENLGKYIVFEGPDGAGKSTIALKVAELIENSMFVRNPGSTDIGKKLRDILKHDNSVTFDSQVEQILFLADHVAFCNQVLRPKLLEGCYVLADRHNGISGMMYSSMWVQKFYDKLPDLKADLLLVFECPFEVCQSRSRGRGEVCKIESRGEEFLRKVHDNYRNYDDYKRFARNVVNVDSSKSEDMVVADVLDAISMISF
jgi:dTMP kinase